MFSCLVMPSGFNRVNTNKGTLMMPKENIDSESGTLQINYINKNQNTFSVSDKK